MKLLLLIPALLLGLGCSVQKDYVAADEATYGAVAPDWLKRSDADPTLSQTEKDRRHRLADSWAMRIKANKP